MLRNVIAVKKFKRYTPSHLWKEPAESLFSKLGYCNILFDNIHTYMKNQLQKIQNATAGFVLNKYAKIKNVLKLKWLTIEGRIELSTFCSKLYMTINF